MGLFGSPVSNKKRRLGLIAGLLLLGGCGGWVGVSWATLPDVATLADHNPETTALIEVRAREAQEAGKKPRRRQRWVPLAAISPLAVQAVIASEDSRFWQHEGVDTVELEKAMAEALEKHKLGRGASTITQQLAKNLWLSEDRSLLRKGKELILARRMEETLSKKRILTIYLNVVEWGQGVYGIEAAAREHFGVSAAALSPAQAAMLASMLPAPRRWIPAWKPPALRRRALRLIGWLEAAHRLNAAQASQARAEIEARLGKAKPNEKPLDEEDEEVPEDDAPLEASAPSAAEKPAASAVAPEARPEAAAESEGATAKEAAPAEKPAAGADEAPEEKPAEEPAATDEAKPAAASATEN